jgi:hypothetical protein
MTAILVPMMFAVMEAVAIQTIVNLVTMNSSAMDLRDVAAVLVNLIMILVLLVPAMRIITPVAVMDIVRLVKIYSPVPKTVVPVVMEPVTLQGEKTIIPA